jgi:hypothetical protein
VWTNYISDTALGHAVTAVGYIPAGDADDKWLPAGLNGPTDWVIVHDNWFSTPRNVIIPYTSQLTNFVATWIANSTAVPWPTATKFVKGLVPDWNQPYRYSAQFAPPNGGPPPDPQVGAVNQWNDWCAPTSGANLVGHWADHHCAPVADTTAFDGSTAAWAAPSWQDYLADGTIGAGGRPAPQVAPWLPAAPTDIGWYMDANHGVAYDAGGGVMGGCFFGNGNHAGTYLKDIYIGLQYYLNTRYTVAGAGWNTGTEGKAFAAGMNPAGGPAQTLTNEALAFGEVMSEINRDHTLILCFLHWNIGAAPTGGLPSIGTNTESDFGGTYYQWGPPPAPGVITNAEDEYWNLYDGG